MTQATTKTCLRCERRLSTSDFSRHRSRPDGLQAYCKACYRTANKVILDRNAARTLIESPAEKTCGCCGLLLPIDDFHTDRRRVDGHYSNCCDCHRRITDAWKALNKAAVARHRRASKGRHYPKYAARAVQWRRENAARVAERARAYKLANRARCTALETIRRGRNRSAPGIATVEQVMARWSYYGGKCWMCGDIATATDHVKPLAKGGSNWPANLRPACRLCNSRKNATWPYQAR